MNSPTLTTARLILRKFTDDDIEALFEILSDEEVNRFLPWHPVKDITEARIFYLERYASRYSHKQSYAYAICMKENDRPIGYIGVDTQKPHDLGYGLKREFWNKGFASEAARAVIECVKRDGLPYITATHDRNNPASGCVMRNVGMKYKYSYEEIWQPKNIPVIFRMYQLNLDGTDDRVYMGYWDQAEARFIENPNEPTISLL